MDIDELRRRARAGELSPDDVHMIVGHMRREHPDPVRARAIGVASEYVAATADPAMILALITIAESKDAGDDGVRTDAVRALAKATGYKGQRIQIDL